MTTHQKLTIKVILVVDDDGSTRGYYKRGLALLLKQLAASDIDVFEYESGQEALDSMKAALAAEDGPLECRYEYFIVSDGNMPDMNGDEFLGRASHLLDTRIKRAFLITGNPDEFRAAAGPIGYTLLGKPTVMNALIDDLRSFLFSDAPS